MGGLGCSVGKGSVDSDVLDKWVTVMVLEEDKGQGEEVGKVAWVLWVSRARILPQIQC